MMNSPRGKGKKIDLEDCVTEYDIMDGDGCLIGPDLKMLSSSPNLWPTIIWANQNP